MRAAEVDGAGPMKDDVPAGDGWDGVWGPYGPPKARRIRSRVKKGIARIAAFGRSAKDASRGVAILAYHGTGERGSPWWVDFRGQMTLIEDLGYRVVALGEAVDFVRNGAVLRQPTLAITFDDGFANNLDLAYPELARRGWPATVFLTTSWIGRRPYMSREEVVALRGLGIEVGNHTHTHPRNLAALSPAAIRDEVTECSRRLEDLTGLRARHFCYPNGQYDPRVRDAIAETGLESACSGRVGFNAAGRDPFVLARLTIERGEGPRELRTRLAGGYDFLDVRQRRRDRV